MWFSWIGFIVAGGLAFYEFRAATHEPYLNEWSNQAHINVVARDPARAPLASACGPAKFGVGMRHAIAAARTK
jgi:hypothetical protein